MSHDNIHDYANKKGGSRLDFPSWAIYSVVTPLHLPLLGSYDDPSLVILFIQGLVAVVIDF